MDTLAAASGRRGVVLFVWRIRSREDGGMHRSEPPVGARLDAILDGQGELHQDLIGGLAPGTSRKDHHPQLEGKRK